MKKFTILFAVLATVTGGANEATQSKIDSADYCDIVQNEEMVQITQDNFEEMVAQSKMPLIVDINATWCRACQMMNPIFDELSEEYKGKIQFAKIDADREGELIAQYNVSSLPTLLFFKPGRKGPVMTSVGAISKKELKAKIQEFLKK